jgi:ABC-2 type transport system permease protein
MIAPTSPLAKRWPVLVRREFWEHRSLWITPLVMAGLYLLACVVTGAFVKTRGMGEPVNVEGSPLLFAQFMFTAALFGLMSIVLFFYLADCLYAERKDRSILFWKSLPVSDTATVLTKLAVAVLIVPLGLYLLTFVINLAAFGILYLRLHNDAVFGPLVRWDTQEWLHLNATSFVYIFILALWYAPVAAYQLLVSAWAKSSVLVWTVLPPLVLMFGERLLFGTWYVWETIRDRLGINITGMASGERHAGVLSRVLSHNIDVIALLMAPAMWIGIIVAAGLVFAAIRIRRYRDDS